MQISFPSAIGEAEWQQPKQRIERSNLDSSKGRALASFFFVYRVLVSQPSSCI